MIREQKINWFPIKKAIIIEGRNKEKKDLPGLFRRLNTMEDRIDGQGEQLRKIRRHQHEQSGSLKELKKSLDELKALLLLQAQGAEGGGS
jgi:hypothetical protein